MKVKHIVAWACDFSPFRGEGILARNFAKDLSKQKKINILVKTPSDTFFIKNGKIKNKIENSKKKINFDFFQNYLWPIYGILFLWKQYLKKNKVLYLNFMPLWNFLLFYFLPPKTVIGPITGFIPKKKIDNISSLIRIILIPIFYKFSLLIIFKRFNSLIFSTDLLKKKFFKKDYSKLHFNYLIASSIKKPKKTKLKRNIDFLVYNRNYSVKEHYKLNKLIRHLIEKNFTVNCVGDTLNIKGLKNYGIVSRKKTLDLLQQTKLILSSPENPYSFFNIDALNMGVKVIFDRKYKNKLDYLIFNPKHFVNFDDQNYNKFTKLIINRRDYNRVNYRYLKLTKKRIFNHFKNINF